MAIDALLYLAGCGMEGGMCEMSELTLVIYTKLIIEKKKIRGQQQKIFELWRKDGRNTPLKFCC